MRIDGVIGQVRLGISDQTLTAVMTCDALEALKLKRGDSVVAIVKSTDVMVPREAEAPAASRRPRTACPLLPRGRPQHGARDHRRPSVLTA